MDWVDALGKILLVYVLLQFILGSIFRYMANASLIHPVIKSKKNLQGYYAIVTGANTGIGYQVAKYLVNHGAHVVLLCRNKLKGTNAESKINAQIQSYSVYEYGKAVFMQCDLSSLESIKLFIKNYKNQNYPLHLLINNAGISGRRKFKFTKDSFGMTWQINYLSHFLLTHELIPIMIKSIDENKFDSRIVNTSSMWHNKGYIDFDVLNADETVQRNSFVSRRREYGDSKLAQVLHATYLQQQVFMKYNVPISIGSIHPGGVRTNIFGTDKWRLPMKVVLAFLYPAWCFGLRTAEEGSRNTIYCSVAPFGDKSNEWGGNYVPGAYHVNMKPSMTSDPNGQSTSELTMKKLYRYSLNKLNLIERTKDDYKALMNAKDFIIHVDDQKEYFKKPSIDNKTDPDDKPNVVLKDGVIVLTEKNLFFYSVISGQWNHLSDLTEKQQCFDGPSLVYNNDIIYRVGGRNIKTDNVMKYCEYFKDNKWYRMNCEINTNRCSAGSIFLQNKLLLIGGDDNGDELASMEEYDFNLNKWTTKDASMNYTRNDFGICHINDNEILVAGGHSVSDNGITGFIDTMEKYNYIDNKWEIIKTALPNGKRARCGIFNCKLSQPNHFIVAGGTSPCRNTVECIDLVKMEWMKYPNLNNTHWWPSIGCCSTKSPQILYVVGRNEKDRLPVVEYLDVRDNKQKWNTQNIINNSDKKVISTVWV